MISFFKRALKPARTTETSRSRLSFDDRYFSRIYAIGDVHGRLDLVKQAETEIIADANGVPGEKVILYLGDYVDRGPESAGVLEHMTGPEPAEGFRRICLCGNHDDVMLRFIDSPKNNMEWLRFGSDATFRSYNIDSGYLLDLDPTGKHLHAVFRENVPEKHQCFLKTIPVMVRIGQIVFVHAGIVPGIPLEEQSDQDLMWIREPFLTEGPGLNDLLIVHGHTPMDDVNFGPGRIGIDTGAFATGKLSILRIADGKADVLNAH